ncbi:MAG: DotU family type IV/VI secretion system protein [Ignavibacteriales bacterium]|nr:MAG: DotU family type IV/VI secretion system protein [Ignavibacteriales bacterium]RPI70152.1 MAG: DotU family type IV/VI secretion system protein [Ignavibacteriales bacterium]
MLSADTDRKKKTLADISAECLMLILQLRAANDYGDPSNLKTKVIDLFDKFEQNARGAGIDNEKIRMAKFALVAFLDETIISSGWQRKDEWLTEPLQIKMFDTFNAGEEFFTNLHSLRQRASSNKDVLEVYYLCLTLGFKGMYQLQSPETLRRVVDELNLELHPELYNAIDAISPNGKPKDNFVHIVKGGLPLWVYPVSVIIICVVLYLIMSMSISGKADEIIASIKNLIS